MTTSEQIAVKSTRQGGLTFIEQLHATAGQLCPNPKVPYVTGIKGHTVYLSRGACKLWSCPVCGARNGRKWLARMLNHMNHVSTCNNWYFLTITAHRYWRGSERSRKNIQQGWKKLYNRMRRQYGVSEYVKVWEWHDDAEKHDFGNSWHLHLLIGRKIGQRWLKDNSHECGMGYMAHSSKTKNPGQVAGYASKYLLKSFENADKYLKGMRRIEASRNWTKLPEMENDMERWIRHDTRTGQNDTVIKLRERQGIKQVIDRRPSEEDIRQLLWHNDV